MFRIADGTQPERLDCALVSLGAFPTRSAAVRAVESGRISVNGVPLSKSALLHAGDVVSVQPATEREDTLVPADIPLDIRFEDEYLLVLSKQAGLVCQPDASYAGPTLVNALIAHCGLNHLGVLPGDEFRPGLVHRLDKDTSGLMLAAKTNDVALSLHEDIRNHVVERRYLALVHGNIIQESGLIDAPVARSDRDRKKMAVRDCPSARDAQTSFRVIARYHAGERGWPYTLVLCRLHTGRTHQIRVHMEYIRHPVVGDPVYHSGSPKNPKAQLSLTRQFLHSCDLRFTHPITAQKMSFRDALPDDLSRALWSLPVDLQELTSFGKEWASSGEVWQGMLFRNMS